VAYDARFARLAASGQNVHGEADLVMALLDTLDPPPSPGRPARVLDAGCGTGRVAIELAARGAEVWGVDVDPVMVERARQKAPDLPWAVGDLADPGVLAEVRRVAGSELDLAVLAGNVLRFVSPGTESSVIANVASVLRTGGLLVAGFQLLVGGFGVREHDEACAAAGLEPVTRTATWNGAPFPGPSADYAVSVHRRR
jgi:SAM-dependent methyltransferase